MDNFESNDNQSNQAYDSLTGVASNDFVPSSSQDIDEQNIGGSQQQQQQHNSNELNNSGGEGQKRQANDYDWNQNSPNQQQFHKKRMRTDNYGNNNNNNNSSSRGGFNNSNNNLSFANRAGKVDLRILLPSKVKFIRKTSVSLCRLRFFSLIFSICLL